MALSRTEVPAPQGDEDTAAKSLAILRCADNEADRLTRACIKNPNRFKRRASAVLTRCSSVSPTAEEKKTEGPFRFRQPCQARSIRFVRDTALVWICSCKYRSEMPQDVLVVPSRAQFNAASPAEVTALERCTRRKQAQLDDVCSRTPQDFKTLASHLMESCCKELRVDSKSKFQCEKAGFM